VEEGEDHDNTDTPKNNPDRTQKGQVESLRRQEEETTSTLKSMNVGGQAKCQGHGRQEKGHMNQEVLEKETDKEHVYVKDVAIGRAARGQTEPRQEKDEKHVQVQAEVRHAHMPAKGVAKEVKA